MSSSPVLRRNIFRLKVHKELRKENRNLTLVKRLEEISCNGKKNGAAVFLGKFSLHQPSSLPMLPFPSTGRAAQLRRSLQETKVCAADTSSLGDVLSW